MSMDYKEVSRGLPQEELKKYSTGIDLVGNFVDSLGRKGLLPKRFEKAVEPSIIPVRSSEVLPHRIPFKIEVPEVSKELYSETRRAVEATGAFITSIRSVSIRDLSKEDRQRRQWRFDANRISGLDTFPPEMEIFINPKAVRIKGSNNLSTDEQKKKIAEAAARFKKQLPESVRSFVDLHMADPSTYSQLEDAWMEAGNGLLFQRYFARTDVQNSGNFVSSFGRSDQSYYHYVYEWYRGHGHPLIFAVPVGVLPQKLAA